VRFIGDARARIVEDFLRILRFFRFLASYGSCASDETALAACAEFAGKISTISGERIQHEMLKLLAADAPFSVLELMQKQGVFIHAFGFSMSSLRGAISDVAIQKNPPTRLAFLLLNADIPALDVLSKIKERWKISGALHKQLLLLINNVNEISHDTEIAKQKHLIRKLRNDNFLAIVALKNALAPHKNYQKMLELANSWQAPTLPITGADLLAIGTPQGKELGEKLRALEKTWEESDYTLTREDLLES
jgi:poly(A) polymerase